MVAVNKQSTVWQFTEQTAHGNQVECRLCQAKLAYSNSTGSMQKHPNKFEGETAAGIGSTASGSQASMRDDTYKLKKSDKAWSAHISILIAEMVALDMQTPLCGGEPINCNTPSCQGWPESSSPGYYQTMSISSSSSTKTCRGTELLYSYFSLALLAYYPY